MSKKYILDVDVAKEMVEWFAQIETDSSKDNYEVLDKLYWKSAKEVCDKNNPIIFITTIIKLRLENYSDDSDVSEILQDSFFQAIFDKDIDGCLNANESTLKQASLMDFLNEDYIIICKNSHLIDKLKEQNLKFVELKDFKLD